MRYLRQGEAFLGALDYEDAFAWATAWGWTIFSESSDVDAFRHTIEQIAVLARPPWTDDLPLGRSKVLAMLDEDAIQCLEIAGLLDNGEVTLTWWDRMASWARSTLAEQLLAIGREAERKSLELERAHIAGSGHEPTWVAIEDNAAGYDIRSWRRDAVATDQWRAHSIEVKGSPSGLPIHLSRGEWDFARQHRDQWELQVWVGEEAAPIVAEVDQIVRHIPTNNGAGRWETAQIPIRAIRPQETRTDRPLRSSSTETPAANPRRPTGA